MKNKSMLIRIFLIVIAIAFFTLLAIPNAKASENVAMVSMFEPDEGIMIPVIQRMIAPRDSIKDHLYYFLLYGYYFYGFPFFSASALVAFPFQWLNQVENIPALMLALRQIISVLPSLLAILLLVYMHDRFRSYRSVVMLIFLLFVPAVVRNNFWWHPDGIVLLLSTLVLYFLYTDKHQLGWRFLFAALICGVLTATKLVGAYFFLAVGLSIIWGLISKTVTWKKAIVMSFAFLLIMLVTFVFSNPFLLIKSHRTLYINTFRKQTDLLSFGYGIIYDRGLVASWPLMREYYGGAIFLIATFAITFWNIVKKETRFLHALTLAWFVPLTFSILSFSHFKYQYWIPVAIPLFAGWTSFFPDHLSLNLKKLNVKRVAQILLMLIFIAQGLKFGIQSGQMIYNRTLRKENNGKIAFYTLAMEHLQPLDGRPVFAYYDYRLYMPQKEKWATETSFELLDYDFIRSRNFDVLFLLQQRIYDYIHPDAVGVDTESFARSQAFYHDANEGSLDGYYLIFRNETALLYVRHDVCNKNFDPDLCQ